MFKRDVRVVGVLAALITVAATAVVVGGSSQAATKPDAGPENCAYTTELINRNPYLSMKGAARILETKCGYRYRSGQQDNHLVITQVGDTVRFVDRRTDRIDKLADSCTELKVDRGIAAECPVGYGVSPDARMLIEVWPRLGDDFVDGSSLSDDFSLAVLADGGDDTALLGAGPDFFNGAFGKDRVRSGAGDDWIRSGDARDHVNAGPGNDHITSGIGADSVVGGEGSDRLYCGPGNDTAFRDGGDLTVYACESVTAR